MHSSNGIFFLCVCIARFYSYFMYPFYEDIHFFPVALDDDGNPFIGNHIDVNEVDPTTSSM